MASSVIPEPVPGIVGLAVNLLKLAAEDHSVSRDQLLTQIFLAGEVVMDARFFNPDLCGDAGVAEGIYSYPHSTLRGSVAMLAFGLCPFKRSKSSN